VVVPILIPRKDLSLASSYKPISLSRWCASPWSPWQTVTSSGFWVLNELVNLEHQIPKYFLLHTTPLAVLFDLDEAYDTNWRYDMLRNIHRWNLRGRLPLFISNFPKTVTSVSALAMFYPPDTSKKWSATGICVKCYPFLNFHQWDSERVWSVCVNVAVCQQRRHFLRFSGNLLHRTQITIRYKSSLTLGSGERIFFLKNREPVCTCNTSAGLHPHPTHFLQNCAQPFVPSVMFLRLFLDSKLSWEPHLWWLRVKCQESLNVLKVLFGRTWGGDRTVMLLLYR
jgi:hypothetical protein